MLRRTYAFGQNNSLLERGGVVLNPGNGTISVNGKLADLTKNELKILQILFEHQGACCIQRVDYDKTVGERQLCG